MQDKSYLSKAVCLAVVQRGNCTRAHGADRRLRMWLSGCFMRRNIKSGNEKMPRMQ